MTLQERNRIKSATYRARHPERRKATQKQANKKQRERIEVREREAKRLQIYFQENPDANRKAVRKYCRSNGDKVRVWAHNRRAKIKENGGVLSTGIIQILFVLQSGKCPCCGLDLGNDYELDHIVPVSKGGRNEDSNVQLLRSFCNRSKHDKLPEEWLRGLHDQR